MPDSYKYTKHDTLDELIADLRNKMGSIINHISLLEVKDKLPDDKKEKIENIIQENIEVMIKTKPLILQYLDDIEEFDIRGLKRNK
jgi:hypothetical protein